MAPARLAVRAAARPKRRFGARFILARCGVLGHGGACRRVCRSASAWHADCPSMRTDGVRARHARGHGRPRDAPCPDSGSSIATRVGGTRSHAWPARTTCSAGDPTDAARFATPRAAARRAARRGGRLRGRARVRPPPRGATRAGPPGSCSRGRSTSPRSTRLFDALPADDRADRADAALLRSRVRAALARRPRRAALGARIAATRSPPASSRWFARSRAARAARRDRSRARRGCRSSCAASRAPAAACSPATSTP